MSKVPERVYTLESGEPGEVLEVNRKNGDAAHECRVRHNALVDDWREYLSGFGEAP